MKAFAYEGVQAIHLQSRLLRFLLIFRPRMELI